MTRWERFCVVGVGGHARTKLIPAIQANGQTIVGLVSRQPSETLPSFPIFTTLEEALATLRNDTVIVIASPPSLHYPQLCAVIEAGFDVIVEKPALVNASDAHDIAKKCATSGTVLVEAFMQRHTRLYRRLIDFYAANPVAALDITFTIPAIPQGTFRSEKDVGSSGLYDIGCYILALLNDLGLDVRGLDIVGIKDAGTMTEALTLAGKLSEVAITASIGVGPEYRNEVSVQLACGSKVTFQPIFYGRSGVKMIGDQVIEDCNAFEAMFAVSREQWLADQSARLAGIISVTARLETMASQLARFRIQAASQTGQCFLQ